MKVSIVGIGRVGVTVAFALTLRNLARELVLVGRNRRAVTGEALDLQHAQSFVSVPGTVREGEVADTAGSDVIVFCASVPMPEGAFARSRLGPGNAQLVRELLPALAAASPGAVVVMVSNPVDVLTWVAREATGFPAARVIGTGTLIDSARFRQMLSAEVGIHPDDLRAYILGEHGPTQFAAMSCATAGGEPIDDTPQRRELFARAAGAGIEIFRHKGHTNFGVAMAAVDIIEAIAHDARRTLPVSTVLDGFCGIDGVCLSLPCVVGRGGIFRVLHPSLNAEEQEALRRCAASVREQLDECRA